MKKITRYDSLNGLRTISCIGIVFMHVMSNINYTLDNTWLYKIISSFTELVYLFMIISSFSMCCGYYEKIKNNKITLEEFYTKRIKKILPFFLLLVIMDVIYNHDLGSLIEGFANSTMMFGFLPRGMDVIGVGWFLGLIFIFYMIFPFFVFLFSNKKRAWIVTIVSIIMNFVSIYYFNISRINMFYSFVYFCIGGLAFLYKDKIINMVSKKRIVTLILIFISIVLYYIIPTNKYLINIEFIIVFGLIMCYAISVNSKVLDNKLTSFISNISLEIYLSHMFMFRIVEKLHLTSLTNNNYLSYIITCLLVLFTTIVFSMLYKMLLKKMKMVKTTKKYKKEVN